jgi:hypothetical protein
MYTFTQQWPVTLCRMNSFVGGILSLLGRKKNPTTYLTQVRNVMLALVILNTAWIQKRLHDSCNVKLSKNSSTKPLRTLHRTLSESLHWDNCWYLRNLSQCLYSSKIQQLSLTNNYTSMTDCSRVLDNGQILCHLCISEAMVIKKRPMQETIITHKKCSLLDEQQDLVRSNVL